MSSLRTTLSVAVLVLLGAGYLGSQYAFFNGGAPQWAEKMDQPPIVWLSLLFLAGSIALAFRKEKT